MEQAFRWQRFMPFLTDTAVNSVDYVFSCSNQLIFVIFSLDVNTQ